MAFDPDQYLADKSAPQDNGSFDPDTYLAKKASPEDPGMLESGIRGAAQGATLGFEPVIAGGLSAVDNLKNNILNGKLSLRDAVDQYKKTRDSENKANEAAQKANPISSLAGNIVGGGALTLGTAGAGLLPEAAEGAGLGAKALNAAKIGALAGGTNELGNSLSSNQGLGATVNNTISGMGAGMLAGPAVEAGVSGLKGLGGALGQELADTDSLQKFKKAFGYGFNGVNLTSKAGAQSAQQGVQDAAEALGFSARDLNKQAGAQVGAAKQALQDSGKQYDLNPTLDKLKTAITNLKQSDHPSAQNDANFLQKYLDNLSQKTTSESGLGANADSADFQTASDIKQALTDFGGTSGNGPELKTTDALNASKLAAKDLGSQLVSESPELGEANQKSSASYKALNALGIDDSNFETNPLTGEKTLTPQGEIKLSNTVRQIGRGTDTQSGQNASVKLDTALDYLKSIDPEKAQALEGQVKQAGEINNLTQQGQGTIFGNSMLKDVFNMGPIQVGNRLGRMVGGINKMASVPVNTISGVIKGSLGISSSADKAVSTAIQPLTDDAFSSAAKQMVSSGNPRSMKLASELAKGIGKDNAQKNAILFSLMQQPGYREMLQNHFGSTGDEQ